MAARGADQIVVASRGLLHSIAKGSLITWRLESGGSSASSAIELSDINVAGVVGAKAGVIAAHPRRLHVYVAGLPDGDKDPGDIFLFGLANARCLQRLSGHERKVTHLVWAPNFGLVSGSEDGTCRLWSAKGKGRLIYETGRTKTFLGDSDPEKVAALVADGSGRLFVGNDGGGIDVVELRKPHSVQPLLKIWRERRLGDVPQAAIDAYALHMKKVDERIARKKKAGTLGDTTSEEEKTRRREDEAKDSAEFEPANKRPLAKRSGDHDNAIWAMVLLAGGDAVAATTVAGELVVAKSSGHESLVVFRKSYGGSLALGESKGDPRLYVGNRGYDASIYEVVVSGVEPLRQLHRVQLSTENNMIIGLHWCRAAKRLLVAYDEAGLYVLEPECKEKPQTLFDSKEEDKDSMSNESALGFSEHEGLVFVRTSWSRVRCFQGNDLKELDSLRPSEQVGLVGRQRTCVDRQSGTLWSIRPGYDDYKVDTAKPGDKSWTRLTSLPSFAGWPPSFIKYVEWPEAPTPEQRGMLILGGELGGLYQVKEGQGGDPPRLLMFPEFRCGNVAYHAVAACSAWDAQGALIMVRSGNSSTVVFDWTTRAQHGQLKCKQPTLLTRVAIRDGRSWRPWVAAWDEGAISIFDLRTLAVVQRFLPSDFPRPWCLHGTDDGRLFAHCAVDAKATAGRLGAWRPPSMPLDAEPLLGSQSIAAPAPDLVVAEAEVEAVTSMVVISGVGLLTAHRKVMDGISIWCPRSGLRLCRLRPAQAGTCLNIWPGRGSGDIVWAAAAGGRTGYLRWNSLYMIGRSHAEDGEPRFPVSRYLFFLLDVWSILVSIGQILSFALHPPWEETDIDDMMVDIHLPELFNLEAVRYGSRVLAKLQGMGLPNIPWVFEFYGSMLFIAMFGMLLVGQELIEERAYLFPGSCWRQIFELANKLAKMIVQSLALPLLTYLISGFVCKGDSMHEAQDTACLSRDHFLYFIIPGVLAALALHLLSMRFARVGFELSNLDVGVNLLDASTDYVPQDPEPEHIVSSMSPANQNMNIVGKVVLKVVKTLAPVIRRQGLRLELVTGVNVLVGGMIACSSLFSNAFAVRSMACWFQPCALQFAQDAASAWMFFCIFLAAVVSQGMLPDGGWLDVASYVVIAIFPLGFLLRLIFPMLQARWRARQSSGVGGGYSPLGTGSAS